ncbi:uncharacterized mitochondrial protein AtMg00310-like [Juglans microcarpa x Juglans regia]|uniref:uncharacterized mitochondrial protein AtMg00310-like n=1 Tax=Juglans microcarpa x Juglans regia TaxID=2249226 RepID=UPI001B7E6D10|nr:uncharacterized mitochondrial protein AtMg00310-like [Juglans microcarpa x Juglans regia]
MSVFKLPHSLLKDINSLFHNFWWGQQDRENKIHWISWKWMEKSKLEGVMSFKDLEAFNKVMLAKQCWRLIQQLESLVAKVMKAKYYPRSIFQQAKLGTKPSFIWRCFLSARPLVEAGAYWKVENGSEMHIWKDKWIAHPTPSKSLSPVKVLDKIATVSSSNSSREVWNQLWQLQVSYGEKYGERV